MDIRIKISTTHQNLDFSLPFIVKIINKKVDLLDFQRGHSICTAMIRTHLCVHQNQHYIKVLLIEIVLLS